MPADLVLTLNTRYRKMQDATEPHPPVPDEVRITFLLGDKVTFQATKAPHGEFSMTKREFRMVYDRAERYNVD